MAKEIMKFVKPAEGCLVRYPGTMTQLPASGASVPWTGREGTYWRRRLADGSVVEEKGATPEPAFEHRGGRRGDK